MNFVNIMFRIQMIREIFRAAFIPAGSEALTSFRLLVFLFFLLI